MSCYLENNCKKFRSGICKYPDEFCIRKFKADQLFDLAFIDEKSRYDINVFTYNEDPDSEIDLFKNKLPYIRSNIRSLVKNGSNFYLYSDMCGNGKTMTALSLCKAYIDSICLESDISCKVLFINVPRFLLELKSNISKKSEYISYINENVLNADLVVWDDIGSKLGTEFEIENMLSLINNRLDFHKSNIYTSNISPEMLSSIIGPRLSSRVIGYSEVLKFSGYDKRGVKAE